MTAVDVKDMQRDWLTYLRRVAEGETLLIVDGNQPIAEIRPATASSKGLRPYGLCAGEFRVPDDFDDPLPEDILRDFEGR